ncbi:hypothetical protein KP509_02G033100 [Ceratopteris richardii]|nr:hypothetical protein KP509_02G033100 [Ceratopteris richardii]
MYAKCDAMAEAREVFDEFPMRNEVSWNALISGYVLNREGQRALGCYQRMLLEGLSPSSVTYSCILKACGSVGISQKGQLIHAQIFNSRILEKHIIVGNALMDMYIKCGAVEKAKEVFIKIRFQSVVSWTTLIRGYAQGKQYEEALACFEHMQEAGFTPDVVAFVCILKACGSLRGLDEGQKIHAEVVRRILDKKSIAIANAVIDMYTKCCALEKAHEVLHMLSFWNVVSWTTLIAGYAEYGFGEQALICFKQMQHFGHSPDAVTFSCILKACGIVQAFRIGQEIHAQIIRNKHIGRHVEVSNAVVSMYAKCGAFENAKEALNKLPVCDVIAWNGLIAGYMQHGYNEEAIACFYHMQLGGFSPTKVTYACILKVCGNLGALDRGQEIYTQIARECFLGDYIVVANALVDMYSKCGAIKKAQEVFDELPVKEIVSWTALIAGYVEHEHAEEALSCFERMQCQGLFPDTVTFACILKACGTIGAIRKGQCIHTEMVIKGLLQKDPILGIALIVMYADCGMLLEAQQIFDDFPFRDVTLWSALMVGYAQLGNDGAVLGLFQEAIEEGVMPDPVMFIIVLNTCSHGGLLGEGQSLFEILELSCGVGPSLKHHSCMVDLLSRAGHLQEAATVIAGIPFPPQSSTWQCLLSACQKLVDINIAEWAFNHATE